MSAFDPSSFHSLPQPRSASQASPSDSGPLQRFLALLLDTLAPSQQPRVDRIERSGQTVWRVYDPVSRKTQQLDSEEAVRTWLEHRYYQG